MDYDPFADLGEVVTRTPTNTTPSKSGKKKRKQNPATSTPFANPKTTTPVTTVSVSASRNYTKTPKSKTLKSNKKAKIETQQQQQQQQQQLASFRSLALPVASFSTNDATTPKPTTVIPPVTAIYIPLPPPPEPKYAVPRSTPDGIKWQNAVLATRQNTRYKSDYDFDRVMNQERKNNIPATWIKAKPFGAWCADNPHAIAIDCEMCETKDPITGASNHKALCRLSVVDASTGSNQGEVLIDTLVKPEWPVKDYRSRINGISKEHLDSVQFTLAHAQAFMMALCSSETVIIGHAVHNDLIALRMEHHCNVDSALLFKVKEENEEENAATCTSMNMNTCSLKDLAMSVMKRKMPEVHDSVNDARVAMLCLEEGYVKTDGKPEPIVRVFAKKKRGSSELFVHRIPKGCCTPGHIQNMFLKQTSIQPSEVPKIEFSSNVDSSSTGKTTLIFASAEHANLAFKTLGGESKPDKTGRMQKRIYLRTGGYIYVRQMTMPRKKFKSKFKG